MLNFLRLLLDAILPQKDRVRRTSARTASDIPLSPTAHQLLGKEITTILDYRENATAELLQSLKYDASGHAVKLCSVLLEDYLREEIAAERMFSKKSIVLIPVPLHESRLRERGFNQIEIILQNLPHEFHDGALSYVTTELLLRTRPTKQQTRLSRQERLENVTGAFSLSEQHDLENAHVFLIDDVATTGATLVEASRPLRDAGVNVTLLALARA